jgi:integrase
MTQELTTTPTELRPTSTLAEAGQAANQAASRTVFQRELAEVSQNTRTAYKTDLATWTEYLVAVGVDLADCDFYQDPEGWQGVTYGLVLGFKEWMLRQGFAIASINRKLSCVRRFCKLASTAGVIPGHELALIQTVGTIRQGKGHELDKQRPQTRIERPEAKKAKSIELSKEQAKALKQQPDTPQGRRDALLLCLLLDHGLRAGEIVGLVLANFDLRSGKLKFWREKVKQEQTHKLTADTLRALRAYVDHGEAPALGALLRASLKSGELGKGGMTTTAVSARVRELGERIEVPGLSAHDCRHAWATWAQRNGTDPFVLQQAGGWTSMQTVKRYIEAAKIANEGVHLPY